jgi:arsenate reductase
MPKVGIDLSDAKPQKLAQELANEAALFITIAGGDKCPYVPGLRRADWRLRPEEITRGRSLENQK